MRNSDTIIYARKKELIYFAYAVDCGSTNTGAQLPWAAAGDFPGYGVNIMPGCAETGVGSVPSHRYWGIVWYR